MKACLLAIEVAIGVLGLVSTVAAQSAHTVDRFLSDTTSISELKCQNRGALEKEFKAQGKTAEARSVRLAEVMICECMPAQVKALRATLSQQALQQRMTETEFETQYTPQIVNKCAAEQLRATYGEGCSEQFAALRKNSAAYCGCMQQSLSGLSDSDIAQIGSESSEYVPRAAEAKRRGDPLPEQPRNLKRFSALEVACRQK